MEINKLKYLTIFILILGAIGFINQHNFIGEPQQVRSESNENIESEYNVEMLINGEKVAEKHNVLMEGENITREFISTSESTTCDLIVVGNGTAPADGDTTLDSEFSNCGFSPKTATYSEGGVGKWNYSATYTSTCDDIYVNTTAIKCGDGRYFAGTDFTYDRKVFADDEVTVRWENTVDDAQ